MTHEDQLYTTCEGHSAIDLIAEIDKKVKSLAQRFNAVTIQSISHDVVTDTQGSFIWSALIVANVKDKNVKEDH